MHAIYALDKVRGFFSASGRGAAQNFVLIVLIKTRLREGGLGVRSTRD
jgi:hypothetical protein